MTRELNVAALQVRVYSSLQDSVIEHVSRLIEDASNKGAELICLPEHWLADQVLEPDHTVYRKFKEVARDLGVYINLGAFYEKDGDDTYISSPTISPDGEVISKQKKVHLYRREKKRAKEGKGFELFNIKGINTGVLVCHDVVFPESARTLVLKGAELLLVPSLIIERGIEPWSIYLKARALENRVPVVAPNAFRNKLFPGGSLIVNLLYNEEQKVIELIEKKAPRYRECSILSLLELDSLIAHRLERLNERNEIAYL